jgi:hypothetical protein
LLVLLVVEPVLMLPIVPSVKMDTSYLLTLVVKLAHPTVLLVLKVIPSLLLHVPSVPPPIT